MRRSLFLLCVLLPTAATAAPLTFDAALKRARADAPSLKAKALGADAARSSRGAAGSLPAPTLAVGVDSFPISGPLAFEPGRDNFTWGRVGVSQDIPNLAKRHAAQARADTDIAAADAGTAVEARTVEVNTALAWINLAYAEKRLSALDDVLGRLQHIVQSSTGSVASGNARPAQTLAGQQAIAAMQDRRSEVESSVARARAILTRWTGDPNPQVVGAIPDFPVDAATLRSALDRHPTLRMADAETAQADADVRWRRQTGVRTLASTSPISTATRAWAIMSRLVSRSASRCSPAIGRTRRYRRRKPTLHGCDPNRRRRGAHSPAISIPTSPITSCTTTNGCARAIRCNRSPNSV